MGGDSRKGNIKYVPDNKHKAFHLIFGAGDPNWVAHVLNETWIDPEYKLVVKKR